jgi:hypothetical protein
MIRPLHYLFHTKNNDIYKRFLLVHVHPLSTQFTPDDLSAITRESMLFVLLWGVLPLLTNFYKCDAFFSSISIRHMQFFEIQGFWHVEPRTRCISIRQRLVDARIYKEGNQVGHG